MNSLRSLIHTDKPNMMNSPQKEIAIDTKPLPFAGIDVGAKELVLVIRKNSQSLNPQIFSNTPSDRNSLSQQTRQTAQADCLLGSHRDLSL